MIRPNKNLAKPNKAPPPQPTPFDPEEHAAQLGDKLSDAFWKTADTAYYVTRYLVKSTIQKISPPPPPPKNKIFTQERIISLIFLGPFALFFLALGITMLIFASDSGDTGLSINLGIGITLGGLYTLKLAIFPNSK